MVARPIFRVNEGSRPYDPNTTATHGNPIRDTHEMPCRLSNGEAKVDVANFASSMSVSKSLAVLLA